MSPPFPKSLNSAQLSTDDLCLLARLSPQGVAKLNRDLLSGIPVTQVLRDLRTVYDIAEARHKLLQEKLSEATRTLIAKLGRAATYEELFLFSSLPAESIEAAVQELMQAGFPFDLAIEELAFHFQHHQLQIDARQVKEFYQLDIKINHLAPTVCPPTLNTSSRNMMKMSAEAITIGLSPVVLWFNLDKLDSREVSLEELPAGIELALLDGSSSKSRRCSKTTDEELLTVTASMLDVIDDAEVRAKCRRGSARVHFEDEKILDTVL